MIKSKLYLALALVVGVSILVGGSTFALFTASTSDYNSTITAGKLQMASWRDNGDTVPGPMFYVTPEQGQTTEEPIEVGALATGLWTPGDVVERTLIVANKGTSFGGQSSMHAWLDTVYAELATGSDATLADKLWVEVTSNRDDAPLVAVKVAEGYLSEFISGKKSLSYLDSAGGRIPLNVNSLRPLNFKVTFKSDAGNIYQDKSIVWNFFVTGVQKKNNP